jgi:hypothetical protein
MALRKKPGFYYHLCYEQKSHLRNPVSDPIIIPIMGLGGFI